MTKKNRLLAALLAFALIFVMLSSVALIVSEADHECTSENCSICYQISERENTLKQLSLVVAAAASILAALTFTFVCVTAVIIQPYPHLTPITLKVKLLN